MGDVIQTVMNSHYWLKYYLKVINIDIRTNFVLPLQVLYMGDKNGLTCIHFNSFPPRQNDQHLADVIFLYLDLNFTELCF